MLLLIYFQTKKLQNSWSFFTFLNIEHAFFLCYNEMTIAWRDGRLITSKGMKVTPMTTYESTSLLIQLSAVMLAAFMMVITLIIFFVKKK